MAEHEAPPVAAEGAARGRLAPGQRVRTTHDDPAHHTRLPRYARGAAGAVVELQGVYPLPDDRSRGLRPEPSPVYTVRFAARQLFGAGDHFVTVDVWESHLEAIDDDGADPR